MPELAELKALIHDRQTKDSAVSIYRYPFCLDEDLVQELVDLEAELADAAHSDDRMSGPDTAELEAAVEAKRAEVRGLSVEAEFKRLSSDAYKDLTNSYDLTEQKNYQSFLDDLFDKCYRATISNGQNLNLPAKELVAALSFGEVDAIKTQLIALNQRTIDLPFSLRPSKNGRQHKR